MAATILAASLFLGCEGDQGPAGPQGPQGDKGDTGDQGPSGTSTVPLTTATRINVKIESVTIASPPVVTMRLTNDVGFGLTGLPAANVSFTIAQLTAGQNGSPSEWRSYITREDGGIADVQATTETATPERFKDNGDGTYTYTFAKDLSEYPSGPTYDGNKSHRLGVEIRTNRGGFHPTNIPANNAPYNWVPNGGDLPETRLIVNNAACNACHDNLELHGEARFDVEYCVTCHNPYSADGNTINEPWKGSVNMTVMVHKIHHGVNLKNGYKIIGFRDTPHDYSKVVFSQNIKNCTTCHQESDTTIPQASNWRTVPTRVACGACHDDIDWANAGHPGGLTFPDDSQCVDCHGENSTVNNGELKVDFVHRILEKEAGDKFKFNITSITNTAIGQNPVVQFSVTDPTNNDTPYDIHADPAFTTCAGGVSRLAIGLAWNTGDYNNVDSGVTPGLPISMNPLNACGGNSTAVGDGTYTVTSPTTVPATAKGSLAATMEGHPAGDINGDGTYNDRIAVTNAVSYAPITDATAQKRRNAVAIAKCQDCHNQLSIHGNNRTDNIEVCVTCHAPNVTDINRRAGQCVTDLGADDTSVDFKYMIHALHAGGTIGVPYNVCGFGNRPHTFNFHYPGKLNNCEGCHNPGGYYPVDATKVLGTTVDANDKTTVLDDKVISPNTAVCSTCHVTQLAKDHMTQNGGDFNATKMADGTLVSAGSETCGLCHGPGRSADVGKVHKVSSFQ
jgi:OmcA/MtrC family decaheme c-type cytochrome